MLSPPLELNHYGLCFVQSPHLLFSQLQRRTPVGQLPKACWARCALPAPPAPACSAAGREAAGDSCPWAPAKPHKRAGQRSSLLRNLAEWAWRRQRRGGVIWDWGRWLGLPMQLLPDSRLALGRVVHPRCSARTA